MNIPSLADFESCLNEIFKLRIENSEQELTLTSVETKIDNSRQQSFSVLFSSSKNQALQQRVYTVENEKMGKIDLFLVPIAVGEYESVFSVLKNK